MNLINTKVFNNYVVLLKMALKNSPYVTGFWKTAQIVTLGPFHFIGPANSYTHILPIHSAFTRLG